MRAARALAGGVGTDLVPLTLMLIVNGICVVHSIRRLSLTPTVEHVAERRVLDMCTSSVQRH